MPSTTTHGLEYPVNTDNAALVASNPATNTKGWFQKGWEKLDGAAGHFVILGSPEELWVTRNAVYTGTAWNREDTAQRADGLRIASTGEVFKLFAASGANPISWNSRRVFDADGFLDVGAIPDLSITGAKIANSTITKGKISFPATLTHTLSSDYNVTTNWEQILGLSAPEAGRLLIVVQQAVRYVGSGVQTFNGSIYIGGAAVDPVVTLRTSEANYTVSIPLTIVADISGATSVTYAVTASAASSFQVIASATKLFVTYLPGS